MRRGILTLVLTGLAALAALTGSVAHADVNLDGGVFIAHYVAELTFSEAPSPEDACAAYFDYAITSAEQQVNRIDADGSYSVWYVLAAWWDPQEFCGVEFGLGNYNASIYPIDGYGPCYATSGLQITTGDWPEPNTGIAVVAEAGGGWSGNYLPVYFFGGYAYTGETKIPFTVNPTGTYFAGFATCEMPIPTKFPTTCLPIMGINVDGDSLCIPFVPPPPDSSVCCVGASCYLLEKQSECLILQGTWHPDLKSCDPNPCLHVCCINQDCVLTFNQAACEGMGGRYFPNLSSCMPNPCFGEQPWACCIYEDCITIKRDECEELGGEFHDRYVCGEGGNSCADWQDLHACCLGGYCYLILEDECEDMAGVWHSNWNSCLGSPNPCAWPWACCVQDECYMLHHENCMLVGGTWHETYECDSISCANLRVCCEGINCSLLFQEECELRSGAFAEEFTTCDPNPCPLGACCADDGGCQIMREDDCNATGGWWRVDEHTCSPNPCMNLLHICCDGEECLLIKEAECEELGGEWHPDYDTCEIDTVSCGDPLRVCCVQGEAYPKLLWEAECDILSGEWHEDWESLDPDPCLPPLPEVCCLENNDCLIVIPDSCSTLGGFTEPDLDACDPNPCPGRMRACCLESGGCFLITETACGGIQGAEWHEDESTCDPNPCPQPTTDAVCCAEDATGNNVCMIVSEDLCDEFGGHWHSNLYSCTGVNCDIPVRACCVEDSCSLTWESECGEMGGVYLEDENSCDPNPCYTPALRGMTWGRIKALYRSQKQQRR